MDRIKRQVPFLRAIVSASERNRRRHLLKHANKDQINAISEMKSHSICYETTFLCHQLPWPNFVRFEIHYDVLENEAYPLKSDDKPL